MPKQESAIRKPSKAKATAAAKPAASKMRAASAGGTRRNGGDPGERIRQRAYEIWESEGRPEGREQAHWEQAEREVAKARSPRRQATAG